MARFLLGLALWLAGWLVGWSVGKLVGRSVGRLLGWLAASQASPASVAPRISGCLVALIQLLGAAFMGSLRLEWILLGLWAFGFGLGSGLDPA